MAITVRTKKLPPILKYPGGKEKELPYILPHLPQNCERFFDPFVGGGAVYFALESDVYFINDKSEELMRLYRMIQSQNEEFFGALAAADRAWTALEKVLAAHEEQMEELYTDYKKRFICADSQNRTFVAAQLEKQVNDFVNTCEKEFCALLDESIAFDRAVYLEEMKRNLYHKLVRMVKLELEKGDLPPEDVEANLEGALKAGFYMYFRYLYNHTRELSVGEPTAVAIYLFVREFCYASMFRYNRNGEFNVPYGGISYNKKSILKKVHYFKNQELTGQLEKTVMEGMDFEEFLKKYKPGEKDFVFLDPPYDTEFSTYALNEFGRNAHLRLANYLINHCVGKFMLVIKNTEFIRNLYCSGMRTANGGSLYVSSFAKKYMVSFQERNDKNTEHLMITNYEIE
ncbi:MAG: DNA adenine methylase [Lachnospiraceae bacterium]|nr:DNA adenine methylase [Lachnospiraceae bacterium]